MYVWMKFPIQDYMSSRSSRLVISSYSSLGDLKAIGKVTDNPKATCVAHFLIRKIAGNLPICPVRGTDLSVNLHRPFYTMARGIPHGRYYS